MNIIRSFCLRSAFIIGLIIVLLFTYFNIPCVFAYESDSLFIDLFEYSSGIDGISGKSRYYDGWNYGISPGTNSIHINLPFSTEIRYIDVLIYLGAGSQPPVSFSYLGNNLNAVYFGPSNNYVRLFGYNTTNANEFTELTLDIDNNSVYNLNHTILSLSISPNSLCYFDLNSNFSLTCGNTTLSGSLPDFKSFTFTTGGDYWNSYISIPKFQGFDYVYVSFFTSLNTITSISAVSNIGYIPIETSFIETDGLVDAPYNYVTVMIDLTNIDRTSLGSLDLYISGGCVVGQSHSFTVYEVQGGLISSFDPLNWHLTKIASALGTLAGEMDDPAREQEGAAMKDKGKDTANRVDDAVSGMDAMQKPEVGSGDLTGDVSDIISVDTIEGSTVILSTFFEMPVVSEVVVIALTVALAGYVLFGKRR